MVRKSVMRCLDIMKHKVGRNMKLRGICLFEAVFRGGIVMNRFQTLSRSLAVQSGSVFNFAGWLNVLPNSMAITCPHLLHESRLFASTDYPGTVSPPPVSGYYFSSSFCFNFPLRRFFDRSLRSKKPFPVLSASQGCVALVPGAPSQIGNARQFSGYRPGR